MLTALTAFSGLAVDDIAAAKEFYGTTLAIKITDDQMGLHLELPGGAPLFIYERPDYLPATYTALNFVVEDIDETVDHLVGHGITFEVYDSMPAPQDEKGILRGKAAGQGPDIAWFKDPAGNILSVLEN